jgi:phosphoribosyl 1,2-cyclic phosphate phosphodiesterase
VKATLLGTGSAWPIPRPGCHCAQCEEARASPDLVRTRSALYIETGADCILVDCGPDIAFQLERHGGAPRVDAVVITHRHLDHVLGLDDVVHLRAAGASPLPVHVGEEHREKLAATFSGLLRGPRPRIVFEPWATGVSITRGDVVLEGFETGHRERFATTGVRLDVSVGGAHRRIAYATDMGDVPPSPRASFEGVDLFVGDGTYLGEGGHGHPGTTRVIAMARELGVPRIALTHVGHWQVSEARARAVLGGDVAICRDGDDLLQVLGPD